MSYKFSEMPDGWGWIPKDRYGTYVVVKAMQENGCNSFYYSRSRGEGSIAPHSYTCIGDPIPDQVKLFYIPVGLL